MFSISTRIFGLQTDTFLKYLAPKKLAYGETTAVLKCVVADLHLGSGLEPPAYARCASH